MQRKLVSCKEANPEASWKVLCVSRKLSHGSHVSFELVHTDLQCRPTRSL